MRAKLGFARAVTPASRGVDPEEALAGDELEGFVEWHDLTTEGARIGPGLSSPPQDLNVVALAGRAQPRDAPTGAQAVEGAATVGPYHFDAAAPGRPAVGFDPTAHRVVAAGHGASLPRSQPRSGARGPGRRQRAMAPSVVPEVLDGWMRPFRCHFTAAAWRHVLVLVCGSLLAPGRRTVAAALRVMGLGEVAGFAVHHRVLSHGHWCSRALAHRLLLQLVAAFAPDGPVVVGLDDTIERRWGARIAARGIYRDPVRSSHGHFVKASGLRWLSVMLLAPVPWAGCVWGLPFLTVLAPSERYAAERGKRHKKLTDWAWQLLLLLKRWYPEREIVAVADSTYASLKLLFRCQSLSRPVTFITRLRLDAALYEPAPPRRPG